MSKPNKNPAAGGNQLRGLQTSLGDVHAADCTTKGNTITREWALAGLKPTQLTHLKLIRNLLRKGAQDRRYLARHCRRQYFKSTDTAALINTMTDRGLLKQTAYGSTIMVEWLGGEQ